ncbi:MAG: SagB/ThcOx family dehydrogenase [Pseudomonadota bacterium]
MSLEQAFQYQRRTVYSHAGASGGAMDWSNKPTPYKTYPQAVQIPLPRDLTLPKAPARAVLKDQLAPPRRPLSLTALSNLLFMAYGFTSKVDYGPEVFLYRSAPSAGALYPVEIYLAARGIEGLADGLYHFSVIDFSLELLQAGVPEGLPAPALILTGIFFRSAWKYRDRAFRYCLLDAGHAAENFVLAGRTMGLNPLFTAEFDDRLINAGLNLDPAREAALAVIRLDGEIELPTSGEIPAFSPDRFPLAEATAPHEQIFDLIAEAVRLTSTPLHRSAQPSPERSEGVIMTMPEPDWSGFEGPSLVGAMQNRRSRRNFTPKAVSREQLVKLLDLMQTSDPRRTPNLGFVSNHVADVPDGYYHCRERSHNLACRRKGFFNPALADAALSQDWLGRAMVTLVLTADLGRLEQEFGPRALRLAYLEAGRIGQRAYLAAEVLGWGCCGVGAFFDGDVVRILNLPEGEEPLYLIPVGPIKKRTHGGRPDPE